MEAIKAWVAFGGVLVIFAPIIIVAAGWFLWWSGTHA
jgi:hypothetical protein